MHWMWSDRCTGVHHSEIELRAFIDITLLPDYTRARTHIYSYVRVSVYMCVCVCECMYVCVNVCICVNICMCVSACGCPTDIVSFKKKKKTRQSWWKYNDNVDILHVREDREKCESVIALQHGNLLYLSHFFYDHILLHVNAFPI